MQSIYQTANLYLKTPVTLRPFFLLNLLMQKHTEEGPVFSALYHLETDFSLKHKIQRLQKDVDKKNLIHEMVEELLKSCDKEISLQAFLFSREHRLVAHLPLMQKLSRFWISKEFKICCIQLAPFLGAEGISYLVPYLGEADEEILLEVMRAIISLQSFRSLFFLFSFLQHKSLRIKLVAAHELSKQKNSNKILIYLKKMLFSRYLPFQQNALHLIRELQFTPAIVLLKQIVNTHSSTLVAEAVSLLKSFARNGNEEAYEALSSLRVGAMNFLAEEVDFSHTSFEAIKALLSHSDSLKVKSMAVLTLARLDGIDIYKKQQLLQPFFYHENARLRANCVEAMATMTPPSERDFFLEYLEDANNRVVGNAIVALGSSSHYSIYKDKITIKLELMLSSRDLNTRKTAVYCIGMIQDNDFIEILERIWNSDSELQGMICEILQVWSVTSKKANALYQQICIELNKEKEEPVYFFGHTL